MRQERPWKAQLLPHPLISIEYHQDNPSRSPSIFAQRFSHRLPETLPVNTVLASSALRILGPPAALAVMGVCLSGCAIYGVARAPAPVATYSPSPKRVGPLELYAVAEKFVFEHPGTAFMAGSGDSMQPLYKDHTVIITQWFPMRALEPGMTVVFLGDSGCPVAHVLVKETPGGWIAKGVANPACDNRRVSADNYLGVVIGAFEPTSNPMLAMIQEEAQHPAEAVFAINR